MLLSDIDFFKDFILRVKFTEEKYAEDIINGEFYMNNLNYFINLEKETGDNSVGDKGEGGFVSLTEDIFIRIPEMEDEIRYLGKDFIKTQRYNEVKQIPIFSMSSFKASEFHIHSEDENYINFKLNIGRDAIKLKKMGNTALIFPSRFTEGLKNTQEYNESKLSFKEVEYYDYRDEKYSNRQKNFEERSEEMFYWKHQRYSYQREARIVLHGIRTEDYFKLKHKFNKDEFVKLSTKDFFEMYVCSVKK